MEQANNTGGEPGSVLAQAREAAGLMVEQVADKLHLSPRQVVALESNNFRELPEAPYVRGYLRNYAQLLDVDSAPLVEAFDRLQGRKKLREVSQPVQPKQIKSSDRVMIATTFGVLVVVIGLLIAWWQGGEDAKSGKQAEREPAAMEAPLAAHDAPVLPPALDGPATVMPAEQDTVATTPGQAMEPTVDIPASEQPMTPSTAAAPQPVPPSPAPVVETPAPVAAPTPAVRPKTVTAPPAQPMAKKSEIILYVESDCWADVRDAQDKRLIYETIPGGRVITLAGEAPFRVFLGNAQAVKMFYNGAEYDISKHRRGLVARFTLGESQEAQR